MEFGVDVPDPEFRLLSDPTSAMKKYVPTDGGLNVAENSPAESVSPDAKFVQGPVEESLLKESVIVLLGIGLTVASFRVAVTVPEPSHIPDSKDKFHPFVAKEDTIRPVK